jgi:hypothetical protein
MEEVFAGDRKIFISGGRAWCASFRVVNVTEYDCSFLMGMAPDHHSLSLLEHTTSALHCG